MDGPKLKYFLIFFAKIKHFHMTLNDLKDPLSILKGQK